MEKVKFNKPNRLILDIINILKESENNLLPNLNTVLINYDLKTIYGNTIDELRKNVISYVYNNHYKDLEKPENKEELDDIMRPAIEEFIKLYNKHPHMYHLSKMYNMIILNLK